MATDGLVVMTGNLALVQIEALLWVWEAVVERNDFDTGKHA
jgi:hypothetical protein